MTAGPAAPACRVLVECLTPGVSGLVRAQLRRGMAVEYFTRRGLTERQFPAGARPADWQTIGLTDQAARVVITKCEALALAAVAPLFARLGEPAAERRRRAALLRLYDTPGVLICRQRQLLDDIVSWLLVAAYARQLGEQGIRVTVVPKRERGFHELLAVLEPLAALPAGAAVVWPVGAARWQDVRQWLFGWLFLARVTAQRLLALVRPARQAEKVPVALRVYDTDYGIGGKCRRIDNLVDGDTLTAREVIFIADNLLPENKRCELAAAGYRLAEVRNGWLRGFSWRRFAQLFLLQALTGDMAAEEIERFQRLGKTLVRWECLLRQYTLQCFVAYNDLGPLHIARNAVLHRHGVRTFFYTHSAHNLNVFERRGQGEQLLSHHYAYYHYSDFVTYNAEIADYYRRHRAQVERFHALGCYWSELVPPASPPPGRPLVVFFDTSWGFSFPVTGPALLTAADYGEFLAGMRELARQRPELAVRLKEKNPPDGWAQRWPREAEIRAALPAAGVTVLPEAEDELAVISTAGLVVAVAFTSIAVEALGAGRRALFYDPGGKFRGSLYDRYPRLVAHDRRELVEFIDYWLQLPEAEFQQYLRCHIMPSLDPFCDGRGLTRFRHLVVRAAARAGAGPVAPVSAGTAPSPGNKPPVAPAPRPVLIECLTPGLLDRARVHAQRGTAVRYFTRHAVTTGQVPAGVEEADWLSVGLTRTAALRLMCDCEAAAQAAVEEMFARRGGEVAEQRRRALLVRLFGTPDVLWCRRRQLLDEIARWLLLCAFARQLLAQGVTDIAVIPNRPAEFYRVMAAVTAAAAMPAGVALLAEPGAGWCAAAGQGRKWLALLVRITGQGVLSRLVPAQRGEPVPLAISTYETDFGCGTARRRIDALVDGVGIRPDEVMLVADGSLSPDKRREIARAGLRLAEVKRGSLPRLSWQRIGELWQLAILTMAAPAEEIARQQALVLLLVHWEALLWQHGFRNFIAYNDISPLHIARNALLHRYGVETFFYTHSAHNLNAFEQRLAGEAMLHHHYAGYCWRHFVTYSEEIADYYRRQQARVGQFHVLGCYWSELLPVRAGGDGRTTVMTFDTTWGGGDPLAGPAFIGDDGYRAFLDGLRQLARQRPDARFCLKEKNPVAEWRDRWPREAALRDELPAAGIELLPAATDVLDAITAADLVVAVAFTSPAVEAIGGGRRAMFFDPLGDYRGTVYDAIPRLVAHTVAELIEYSEYWLRLPETEFQAWRHSAPVARIIDPYGDGRGLTRFRALVARHLSGKSADGN